MLSVAIIGLGEVGGFFARDLTAGAATAAAFDIADVARDRAKDIGYVGVADTARQAAEQAYVVFVSVTAASALNAIASDGGLGRGPFSWSTSILSRLQRNRRRRDEWKQQEDTMSRLPS